MKNFIRSFLGLHELRHDISRILNRLEVQPSRPLRQRVYVTLRGFYKKRIGDDESSDSWIETAHGWTQHVDTEEGQRVTVTFDPMNTFRCERVDVLGPATIVGVRVGRNEQTSPRFEAPATFEFSDTCQVGCNIRVDLVGIP